MLLESHTPPNKLPDKNLAGSKDLGNYAEEELELLLDFIIAHPKRLLENFFLDNKLFRTGTKETLRQRLLEAISSNKVSPTALIDYLDKIEGWGNQHIFLYQSTPNSCAAWDALDKVQAVLQERGLLHLLNRRKPIILPEQREISMIAWASDRMRIQWVEKRFWEQRVPEQDRNDGDCYLRGYRKRKARSVTSFDWDLYSGHAALLIQRLPNGSEEKYEDIRDSLEEELEPLIGIRSFNRILLAQAIKSIEDSREVRRRQYRHETQGGGVASFTSAGRSKDAFEDSHLENARQALGRETVALYGNHYWRPVSDGLDREIHISMYAKEQRIAIWGSCTESEVHYLLSRIRYFSSTTS